MTKTVSRNILIIILLLIIGTAFIAEPELTQANITNHITKNSQPVWAVHFDFPVGKPDAKGYYNAQGFGKNNHLGDDWNGNGGGNTDLGDTIYAVANGYLISAEDVKGGWGNVIIIRHYLDDFTMVNSLYAHCNKLLVKKKNQLIRRGDPIGTIGTANGIYPAHLHFEMRHNIDLPIGGGYSRDTSGYLDPTQFINAHR